MDWHNGGPVSYQNGRLSLTIPGQLNQPTDQDQRCDIVPSPKVPPEIFGWERSARACSDYRRVQARCRTASRNILRPTPAACYFDTSGTLWIGSWGAGLIRMREGRFNAFTPADGLPCDKIQSILPGPKGTLWLSSDNGLVGAALPALNGYQAGRSPPLLCWRVSVSEGLGNRCCSGSGQPVSTRTTDGRLWFPNYEGVAIMDRRAHHHRPGNSECGRRIGYGRWEALDAYRYAGISRSLKRAPV